MSRVKVAYCIPSLHFVRWRIAPSGNIHVDALPHGTQDVRARCGMDPETPTIQHQNMIIMLLNHPHPGHQYSMQPGTKGTTRPMFQMLLEQHRQTEPQRVQLVLKRMPKYVEEEDDNNIHPARLRLDEEERSLDPHPASMQPGHSINNTLAMMRQLTINGGNELEPSSEEEDMEPVTVDDESPTPSLEELLHMREEHDRRRRVMV